MKRAAALLLGLIAPAAFAAGPCDAPDLYVRASKLATLVPDTPTPLLRPYVIDGLAAVALREADGARWLELAVHSADEARRHLVRSQPAGAAVGTWQDRVWMRCPGAAPRT